MPQIQNNPDQVKLLPVRNLKFDEKNPRFPEAIARGPTEVLLEKFIKDERLLEIVDSIGNHDFFHGEPLVVVPIKSKSKSKEQEYKVVEGNRRLAALKLLSRELQSPSGRLSIIDSVEGAAFRPEEVPCIIFSDENKVMRYLGFRHITGVKSWGALQKARYAKRLWAHYKDLKPEEGLKKLAKEIGSRADYVGQILTSLQLYEMAEAENFFGLELLSSQIEFSVLTTALSYKNITDFIGLDSRTDLWAKDVDKENVKNLFDWLFVAPDQRKPVVPDSRDLKKLAAILPSKDAVKELRASRQLVDAYEMSKGPEAALLESLRTINRRLDACQKLVVQTPDITSEHRELAQSILNKADYLYSMANKPKRVRK